MDPSHNPAAIALPRFPGWLCRREAQCGPDRL